MASTALRFELLVETAVGTEVANQVATEAARSLTRKSVTAASSVERVRVDSIEPADIPATFGEIWDSPGSLGTPTAAEDTGDVVVTWVESVEDVDVVDDLVAVVVELYKADVLDETQVVLAGEEEATFASVGAGSYTAIIAPVVIGFHTLRSGASDAVVVS